MGQMCNVRSMHCKFFLFVPRPGFRESPSFPFWYQLFQDDGTQVLVQTSIHYYYYSLSFRYCFLVVSPAICISCRHLPPTHSVTHSLNKLWRLFLEWHLELKLPRAYWRSWYLHFVSNYLYSLASVVPIQLLSVSLSWTDHAELRHSWCLLLKCPSPSLSSPTAV